MAIVQYSHEARDDLEGIKKYISDDLVNPQAAVNTVSKITRNIRNLEMFPEMGSPLSSVIDIDTNYRFLVCGNYLTFYRVEGENVLIIRVLYGKRDYVKILFGDIMGSGSIIQSSE